jgi:hypothetical protein
MTINAIISSIEVPILKPSDTAIVKGPLPGKWLNVMTEFVFLFTYPANTLSKGRNHDISCCATYHFLRHTTTSAEWRAKQAKKLSLAVWCLPETYSSPKRFGVPNRFVIHRFVVVHIFNVTSLDARGDRDGLQEKKNSMIRKQGNPKRQVLISR